MKYVSRPNYIEKIKPFIGKDLIKVLIGQRRVDKSYLLMRVRRKIVGKKILEIGDKFFFSDLGIRNAIFGYETGDVGKFLENLVYLELKRRGYDVYVGYVGEDEIDFIAENGKEKIYIQVTYLLSTLSTVEREFSNLMKINDGRRIVVTMDDNFIALNKGEYKGVEVVSIENFLLN